MAEQKTYQVVYDYGDAPTLKRFALSNKRVRLVTGPFGCLRGDTLVVTSRGLLPIADITYGTLVLSLDEKSGKFLFSPTSDAFPKGKDYLYRVITRQGEFLASAHHRVFFGDKRYRQVQSLKVGDSVPLCSASRLQRYASEAQLSLQRGDRRSSRKGGDSLDHYAMLSRQYDRQLLLATDNVQVSVPLLNDVQTLLFQAFLFFYGRMDGCLAQLLEHIHPNRFFFPKRIDDCSPLSALHNEVSQDLNAGRSFLHSGETTRQSEPHLLMNALHRIMKLFSVYYSYPSSLSQWPILAIERQVVKEEYWDIQVANTNNYVTADGAIHHNSGKSSAMVVEIIRRAQEQAPSPDGIRRSRWAVIRNTFTQLSDTTIKTFHDWFPPSLFGQWRVTDHSYFITAFPGVHLEILFRALDRPDQLSNLLSLEITGAWFNEAREIPKTIIEAMDSRIGRYPSPRDGGASWYGMIMDTNPPDDTSWLYKMFEVVRPDDWEIFKQPSGLSSHAENTKHLPKNYYVNLAKGKDEMYIRVYIHGQYGFLLTGKPVFQSFVDNIHVAAQPLEPMKGIDLILGFDFGLNPTVVIGQITPVGQLRILDELVSDGMGLRQFSLNRLLPLLRQKYFGMNVLGYGDPSGTSRAPTDESTCFEILASQDIGLTNILPASTNAIIPRVGAVEFFLNKMVNGEPGFLLSPTCPTLRKAMNGAYHYEKEPRSIGEEYKPMPLKNFWSHISDSLEYMCMYIADNAEQNKRRQQLLASIRQKDYRPVSSIAGY